jgi:DNA-binding transcriptional LysR family regulator
MLSGTLPNLEVFCRTYETGSFTRAARLMGVTPQAASRSIARLEAALGIALFRRSTRRLLPTEAATRYFSMGSQALALLAAAERDVALDRSAPEGRVRISVPTTYGHHRLVPALGRFVERFPGVAVDLDVSNRNVDFVNEGFDLAVRMGYVAHRTLVRRKLGDFELGVYAAPSYLARRGVPQTPADLARHTCIGFVRPSTGRVLPWTFTPAPQSFDPDATYRCSDDALATIGLAHAGIGLVQTYDFLVDQDLARATLVEVLGGYRGKSRPFSLLYPRAVGRAPAARALIDFIVAEARTQR